MAQDGPDLDPDDYRRIRGMDPAANWLLNLAVADYLPDGDAAIPFLVELRGEGRADILQILLGMLEGEPGEVPDFQDGRGPFLQVPLIGSLDFFEELRSSDDLRVAKLRDYAEMRIVLSSPVAPLQPSTPGWPALPPHVWPADTVFVAVIDDGIAFAHERFRAANGTTRIEAFWNMNSWYPAPRTIPVPLPFPLPGELFAAEINARLATDDEDDIYARTGLIDHRDPRHKAVAWRAAHGTHVLDLAAGYDPDPAGQIPNRPIIAVQLPTPVVARTTGELLDTYVELAITYVLDRLQRLGTNRPPVVINTSFGYIAGPHDGTGPLESYLEGVIGQAGPATRAVLPAGNAHLSRCHAIVDLVSRAQVAFEWMVQPDDKTHSVVEVWLPDTGGNRMSMTVVLPDGTQYQTTDTLGPRVNIIDGAGRRCGLLQFVSGDPQSVFYHRSLFYLAIAPTERAQPHPGLLAPAGEWTLRFDRLPGAPGVVAHAWVQRDDSLYGYPQRGRQSYLDHAAYVRFPERRNYDLRCAEVEDDEDPAQTPTPSPVTRASLFNAIATGPSVITAGGFHDRDCRIAPYTAGGPNTPPEPVTHGQRDLRKPDALLPSEGSKAHPGILAAGSRSGARVAMGGTSVAAPQLARHVADMLAAAPPPQPPADRRAVAEDVAKPPPECPNPEPPDPTSPNRRGWGRLPLRPLDPLPVERYERIR
jgi:hypothetical protein